MPVEAAWRDTVRSGRPNREFVDHIRSDCGSVADIDVVSAAGFIGGDFWEIHSSDAIALVRPVEEAVSDRQFVALAYVLIYPRQKVVTPLWIGNILPHLPIRHLRLYH